MDKNFVITCKTCRWSELSTGISTDLTHLKEIPNSCQNCGKPRRFKCPKCGQPAAMRRIKGNT